MVAPGSYKTERITEQQHRICKTPVYKTSKKADGYFMSGDLTVFEHRFVK